MIETSNVHGRFTIELIVTADVYFIWRKSWNFERFAESIGTLTILAPSIKLIKMIEVRAGSDFLPFSCFILCRYDLSKMCRYLTESQKAGDK